MREVADGSSVVYLGAVASYGLLELTSFVQALSEYQPSNIHPVFISAVYAVVSPCATSFG